MKRSHSKSVPPPRTNTTGNGTSSTTTPNNHNNNNNYVNTFDSEQYRHQTVWPYSRIDTSPPPPYSSREGSQQLMPPSSPGVPAQSSTNRSHRKAPLANRHNERQPETSTEYTPLLDDFTRKFVESQMSVPSCQQVHSSASQLVPPELLVLCQQQSPYNPNFDSVSTTSSNTSFTSEYSRPNSASHTASSGSCGILLPSSWAHLRWFTGNFLLLVTLLSFNLGMLISPQFYSNFFLIFQNHNLTSSQIRDNQKFLNPIFIDLLIASLMQIVLTLIATGSGLILIYAACKVLATLRKRFQLSVKYRIHLSNQTPFPWFFITFERIAYETLGAFFARMLSFILTVYLFGVSVLYVIILSDYLDMLLSLVTYDQIRQLFCKQHAWYLNHNFVISIWLSAVVLLTFGINSFRRHNKHKTSLGLLKSMVAFVGAISVTYVICIVIYVFANSDISSQSGQRFVKAHRMLFSSSSSSSTSSNSDKNLVCLKPNSTFDWTCLDKNWILLISSVPLLIMPFHLNELLITLLFASKQNQPLPDRPITAVATGVATTQQQVPSSLANGGLNSPAVLLSSRLQSDRHLLADVPSSGSILSSFPRRAPFESDSRHVAWGQQPTVTILDDTVIAETPRQEVNSHLPQSASEPVMQLTSLSSLFSRPLHSFTSVRNLFVSVTFFVCLLNIAINAFVYISAFNTVVSINDAMIPTRIRERLEKAEDDGLPLLDFNFLRNYLHFLAPSTSYGKQDSSKQAMKRYLLIGASLCLLLKTTLTYLLLAFRATLAHRTMTTGTKREAFGGLRPRTGRALSSFLFISPFLAWNFFVLLFSLFVERSQTLLHLVLLIIGWLGCFLLFIYPALILLHFSLQSLQKNSLALTSSYALLSVAFKPLRWAKSCFLLGLCLLSVGFFYLVFWLYAYFQTAKSTEMSILPLITHSNSSLLYCPPNLTLAH